MAEITDQDRAAFRERGYVVVPGVLSEVQAADGRRLVAGLLAAEPPAPGHAGSCFLWPRFTGGSRPRQTIYYRLLATGHEQRWREAVTSPPLEFT